MRLKVPQGIDHIQTPSQVYEIKDGFIEIEEGGPDEGFFRMIGFIMGEQIGPTPKPQTEKSEKKQNAPKP